MSDIEKKFENLMKIGMGGLDAVNTEIIKELGRTFAKGEFLIKEGETSKDVFLIIDGKVIVTKEVKTINKVLAVLGPGEIVGEMSFFESTVRSASCIADNEVTVIILNEDVFGQIYSLHPRWVGQILQALSRRIVKTLDLLKNKAG